MIKVENLTKSYGKHVAVSNLSFSIEKGHIYGFLGPNGAGKSTTMNMITGCLAPTEGKISIGEYDIYEEPLQAKKMIGYLPEIPPLYVDQTPREYLKFVAEAKGVPKKEIPEDIDRVIEETHIEDVSDRLIKQLSKGYRQRVGIAQALLGNPEVIILDEPTVGLDPMQIIEIRELIAKLGEKHTVILSSHILSEVEAICDMVLIIHKGELIAFDRPENLRKTLSGATTIELACETDSEHARTLLDSIYGIEKFVVESDVKDEKGNIISSDITVEVDGSKVDQICRHIFFRFAGEQVALLKMNPVKADLEDIYIELTKEGGNEDESSLEA